MRSLPSSTQPPTFDIRGQQAMTAVACVVFLGLLAMGLVLPTLPGRIQDDLGFSMLTVGWVMGIQSVATLLSRSWAGATTDQRGGRYTVLVGLLAMAGCGAVYGLSALLPLGATGGLGLLVAGRLFTGVGEGLIITGGAAWAIGRAGMANAGRAMSWIGLAMFGGLAVGAAMGAAIDHAFGFAAVAVATAVVPLTGLIATATIAPAKTIHASAGVAMTAQQVLRRIWRPGLALALSAIGFAAVSSFVVLTYEARGWAGGAFALTSFGTAHVVARLLFGTWADRTQGPSAVVTTLCVEALGLGMLGIAPVPAVALAGAALCGFGFSMVYLLLALPALRRVPTASQGMAIGLYDGFFDAAMGISALAGGFVAAWLGLPAVFLCAALASIFAAVAAWHAHQPTCEVQN
jgi:predicted MFS family arabinose efflux permease